MDIRDRFSGFASAAWEQCWNHFYHINQPAAIQEPTPAPKSIEKVDGTSYPHDSKDTLRAVDESIGMPSSGDQLVSCAHMVVDPTRYTNHDVIYTGKAGNQVSFVGAIFRLPKEIFQYIPKWLFEVNKVDALKQDQARWERNRKRIREESGQLSGLLISMIRRLAGDAMANIGYWFRGDRPGKQLIALSGQLKSVAKQVVKQTKSWTDSALNWFAHGGLAAAAKWVAGALNWCQSLWRQMSLWLSA
jgi:hypothetical protein